MRRDDAPILEFDPSPTAVIEPTEHIDPTDIPHHAVLCFFQDVIPKAVEEFEGREIDEVRSEIGLVPVYELSFLFFENGVSRKLFIDYGEFAINGVLKEIVFHPPSKCEQK